MEKGTMGRSNEPTKMPIVQGGPGPLFRDPRWGVKPEGLKIFCIFTYNAYFLTWVALL